LQERVASFDIFVGSDRHHEGKAVCSGVLGCRTDIANVTVMKRIECATGEDCNAGLKEFITPLEGLDDHLRASLAAYGV